MRLRGQHKRADGVIQPADKNLGEDRCCSVVPSAEFTTVSRPGQTAVAKVRTIMVNGSKTSNVRFEKTAAPIIAISTTYLTDLIPCGMWMRLLRHRLNENQSSSVPSGHSQPHHALPNTRETAIIATAMTR